MNIGGTRIRRTKGDTISGVLKQSWMYIEYGSKLFRVTGSQNLDKGLASFNSLRTPWQICERLWALT
jgi:hypothetical protein